MQQQQNEQEVDIHAMIHNCQEQPPQLPIEYAVAVQDLQRPVNCNLTSKIACQKALEIPAVDDEVEQQVTHDYDGASKKTNKEKIE